MGRPPKKKKKSKDRLKDETPSLEAQDDGAHADNPTAEPEAVAEEPVPVTAASGTLVEGVGVSRGYTDHHQGRAIHMADSRID